MDQQRIDAKRMFRELSFGKKIEHIWYYYRRLIIIIVLVLMLVAYATYEVMSKPKYDLEGTFYSEFFVSDEQVVEIEEYLSQFVEDYNGDGVKNVKVQSASIAMLGNEVEGTMVMNNKFSSEMAVGLDSFIMVDSFFREVLKEEAYEMAVEEPRELTTKQDFVKKVKLPNDAKVYWVTRAVYSNEQEDEEALTKHKNTQKTEKRIFGDK